MYNEEMMNKALRAFDWESVLALLPEQTVESLRKLLGDVQRSGCLIRLYRLTSGQERLRAKMIESLRSFTEKLGGPSATKALEFLLQQVQITELALAEIEHTLDQDSYSALGPDHQAWSTLLWAAREMSNVFQQAQNGLQDHDPGMPVIIDPLTLRLSKEQGYGLAAGRLHQLSETVANTLRMLGHRYRWSASGTFLLPARVEPDETSLSAAARIARLGDVWQEVLDESKHHRYWGGKFEVKEPNSEQQSLIPGLENVIVSVKDEPERATEFQLAEYIAVTRMQRKHLSVGMEIASSTAKERVKNPRVETVSLAPNELVSESELVTLYMLDNDMHFNATNDKTSLGGLTILEWLRGYSMLEACYAGPPSDSSPAIVPIQPDEFLATLSRGGLTDTQARIFLNRVTFQSGRRDLYDAPLIQTTDGQLFFLASLYHAVNLPLIITSQIGSQQLNVDAKGKTFEKAVLKSLEQADLQAKTFAFTIGTVSYDCDVALLWDGHLFVFECKNYGLPTDDPADRLFFWKRQVDAVLQAERIAKDLGDHPEIVRQHFGPEATWDEIHPVVLNASFLSFRSARPGTYCYDASALGRFLERGTLNEIHSVPIEGARLDFFREVKRLWKRSRPTPEDLLTEMANPSQVSIEREKYYLARRLLRLSPTVALMTETPASKPPDFEPLSPEA